MNKELYELKRILNFQCTLPYCYFHSLVHNKVYSECSEVCPYSYFTSDSKEYLGCIIFTRGLR